MASKRTRSILDFWERDGYGEPDPADGTLMDDEYESRTNLRQEAASGRVRHANWLAEVLGLCRRCHRHNPDTDHVLCELCRVDTPDELLWLHDI